MSKLTDFRATRDRRSRTVLFPWELSFNLNYVFWSLFFYQDDQDLKFIVNGWRFLIQQSLDLPVPDASFKLNVIIIIATLLEIKGLN